MTYLRVRKFSELQHYKDRAENPWIKFYVRLLDDDEMNALPVTTRLLWDRLLLLAQRNANVIRNDPERIAKLVCIETEAVREGIQQLLKGAWLSETQTPRRASKPASKKLANMLDQNRIEKRRSKSVVLEGPLEEHQQVRQVLKRQFPDLELVQDIPAA